jgi:hypothetical protein
MAADVRVEIQDNKRMLTAVKHKVFLIMFRLGRNPAEDTTLSFGINT